MSLWVMDEIYVYVVANYAQQRVESGYVCVDGRDLHPYSFLPEGMLLLQFPFLYFFQDQGGHDKSNGI